MTELLSKARRRVVRHLVMDKGAMALTIGLGGAVLLLLLGTQILDWYWPLLLAAVSLGVGVYQLRKHVPSLYQLAQRIDGRLKLADSLSTAVYFAANPPIGADAVCAVQFREAEKLASGVNLEQALPFTRSRYLTPAAALLLAAVGLFTARYLMTGSLDLRTSLLEIAVDTFFSTPAEQEAKLAARAKLPPGAFDPSQPDLPQDNQDPAKLIPPDAKDGTELKDGKENDSKAGDGEKGAGETKDGDQKQDGDPKDSSANDKQGDKQGDKDGESPNTQQNQDQRSMLDKLRDAVENLMNKMESKEGQKGQQKSGEKQKGKDKGDKGDKGEKGEKSEGDQQADQNQQGDQASEDAAEKQSEAPGKKSSDEAKSGAGENDGKKALEDAKAQEAMGKLSELLGQRSAEITGDVMVEVGSTKQQLRTALTQQKAGHTDAGGEIHRDQVPLMYQQFIDRYFQDIRKAPAASAPKGDAKSAPKVGGDAKSASKVGGKAK
ncbi:MAG: hypothetical protein ABI811_23125 [Acidobacteriota bacterium]